MVRALCGHRADPSTQSHVQYSEADMVKSWLQENLNVSKLVPKHLNGSMEIFKGLGLIMKYHFWIYVVDDFCLHMTRVGELQAHQGVRYPGSNTPMLESYKGPDTSLPGSRCAKSLRHMHGSHSHTDPQVDRVGSYLPFRYVMLFLSCNHST